MLNLRIEMKKIMVIEDDKFAQDFYNFILKKAGYAPLILEDGDLAIKILQTEDVGLVIMDINLKNSYFNGKAINGTELSRYIKQNISPEIPILIVTAYSPSVKGNTFMEDSFADEYIIKPIADFNILLNKVNSMVR